MMAASSMAHAPRLGALLGDAVTLPPGADRGILALADDSREVVPGTLFFARRGLQHNAEDHIDAALRTGAVAVVLERASAGISLRAGAPVVAVPALALCTGMAADRFHGEPSRHLTVLGVTGTNGKTTVSHFVAGGLQRLADQTGRGCGVIGTLGYGFPGQLRSGDLTTPTTLRIHALLAGLLERGAGRAVMEVSSHALAQDRTAGVRVHTAVFTNLSRDHLDFHRNMRAYSAAKRRLFDAQGLRCVVVNLDEAFGRQVAANAAPGVRVIGYRLAGEAGAEETSGRCTDQALVGQVVRLSARGFDLVVASPLGSGTLRTPLLGRFNAYNLLAALGALLAQGVPFEAALACLEGLDPVEGRMQRLGGGAGEPLVVVDYAHTPDALGSALGALREQTEGERWCVFGCGGERDTGKRPQMGAVAERLADHVVLTDDNPREEDSARIIEAVLAGVDVPRAIVVEPDRSAAIAYAIGRASPRDVVLVAGKGHEPYQDRAGVRRPFSDVAAVRAALAARAKRSGAGLEDSV